MKKTAAKTQKVQTQPKINPEVEQLRGQLARALADYDNLVKRTEADKITWIKFSTQKLIQDLLPVVDTFESAQTHLKDSGLAIGINQLKDVLKNEGLVEIRPNVGDVFDENLHEVVDVVSGGENNKIAEVMTAGWKFMDGMVVRHAKVKVFKSEESQKAS